MAVNTIPFLLPKWQSGSFNVIRIPVWEREYVTDLRHDQVYCSFFARPDATECPVTFELYDGEQWRIIGVVSVKAAQLIGANDTGYHTLLIVVKANWNFLYNTMLDTP